MSTSQHTLDKEPTRVEGGGLFPSQPCDHDAPHRAAHHRYSTEQPFLPVYHGSRFANPSPLAFTAVGVSLYLIGMVALKADGLQTLSIIVSTALGYSSVALLVAGIWSFPTGNPFGAALYTTLSGFFFSLTLVLSPWSGISGSYTNASEFGSAVEQLLFAWMITVFVFIVAAHRSSGGLLVFLSLVDFTLLFLALSYHYPGKPALLTVGGSFSIVASFVAWYAALASLLTPESSSFGLPVLLDLTKKRA